MVDLKTHFSLHYQNYTGETEHIMFKCLCLDCLQRMNYWLYTLTKSEQTMGARLPWQLNFILWCLLFMDPQYGTCFILPFLHPEF